MYGLWSFVISFTQSRWMLLILSETRNGTLSIRSTATHLSYKRFCHIKVLVFIASSLIKFYHSWTWYFRKIVTFIVRFSSSTRLFPSIFYLLYILHLSSQLVNTRIIIIVYGCILLRQDYLRLISLIILAKRFEMGKHVLVLAFLAPLNELFPIGWCQTLRIDGT